MTKRQRIDAKIARDLKALDDRYVALGVSGVVKPPIDPSTPAWIKQAHVDVERRAKRRTAA